MFPFAFFGENINTTPLQKIKPEKNVLLALKSGRESEVSSEDPLCPLFLCLFYFFLLFFAKLVSFLQFTFL